MNPTSVLPANSRFRPLINALLSPDEETRVTACHDIQKLDRFDSWEAARVPSWFVTEAEAKAILKLAASVEFPEPKHDWQDGIEHMLGLLWRSAYPSLVGLVEPAYERMKVDRRRSTLLALLGTVATRQAAESFMACIRRHGWPNGIFSRTSEELTKLMKYGDVLLPDVLLTAGPNATGVIDSLINAVRNGSLDLTKLHERIQPLGPFVARSLSKELRSAGKFQSKPGTRWRFSERYFYVRQRACAMLDFAGYLHDQALDPILSEALTFIDPRIVTFATLSCVRRGKSVSSGALRRSATSHETRAILFNGLEHLKRTDLFPEKWRTWEAFAASFMVEWLLYPAELGHEPDDIELGHLEWIDKRKKIAMYIWRFRDVNDPWLAGVSGPFEQRGNPRPTHGSCTFSCFAKWDSTSPIGHLEQCAGSVTDITSTGM
jgi:hypothetical protein